ncbi:RNA exonuclease 4-like [Pectinophora gossypiella]|uniref:RNA exonuclease 4-like n=1 Tax=Pectinophora gossypiella TaxID=13191 RepID=UPI00214ED3EE|nr:RNA exonuclease 4-like [Pectinophora gossypiella]
MSLTNYIAIDCEMVATGVRREYDMLARVSIVNEYCQKVYDEYVFPTERVTDYRTPISGIRRQDLMNGEDFDEVREDVRRMIKRRVIVGHGLEHDLRVLHLSHPEWNIRDTANYPPFIRMNRNRTPSLKWLARRILRENIQQGEHSSVEDAATAMRLYLHVAQEWEDWLDSDSDSSSD